MADEFEHVFSIADAARLRIFGPHTSTISCSSRAGIFCRMRLSAPG